MEENIYVRKIQHLAKVRRIYWKKHALKRILERQIARTQVFTVLEHCEIIEMYLDARPLPSFLILGGYDEDKPLHVVVALDESNDMGNHGL